MGKSKQGTSKRWAKKHSAAKSAAHKACQQATQATRRKAIKQARRQGIKPVVFSPPFAENEYLLDSNIDTSSVTVTPEELTTLLDSGNPWNGKTLYTFELKNKNTGKKFNVGPCETEEQAFALAVEQGLAKSTKPLSFCSAEIAKI